MKNDSKIEATLERIEQLLLLRVKDVFDINEAAVYTGYSVGYLYSLTSTNKIPHYKRNRDVFFLKEELKEWLCKNRVKTQEEIEAEAATMLALDKRNRRKQTNIN